MAPILVRALAGLLIAGLVAWRARRVGVLSRSGALAAVAVGAAAVTVGWNWGALLILYFVASTALSRYRAADKQRRTDGVIAKGGSRDATQVIANGGVFAASALLGVVASHALAPMMTFAALGALSAAAADTWATEVGTLFGGTPRSVFTWRSVAPGTSGGVSAAGTGAMFLGALCVAGAATLLGLTGSYGIVATAGVAGALADSLLGATLQERRWCAACERLTEQPVHSCGSVTMHTGGRAFMDNDLVNLIATIVGAAVASVLASLSP